MNLQGVEEVTDVEVESLPSFRAEQVRDGIEASSLSDARQVVEDLQNFAQPEPAPSPSPSPSRSPRPSADAQAADA